MEPVLAQDSKLMNELGTYSNVSNHPRLLRMRDLGPKIVKIKLDPKTGFPIVEQESSKEIILEDLEEEEIDDEDDMGSFTFAVLYVVGV